MFKFELNQLVWYLCDNKICSSKVLSRKYVDNSMNDANGMIQKNFFNRFGSNCIEYANCHGEFSEDKLFESKESLIKNLKGDI